MSKREQFDNKAILSKLKEKCNSRLRLPSQIHFTETREGCNIHMPADCVCENFQRDFAAFEGLALGLNAWLDSEVTLSWAQPPEHDDRHYQRFLYRVIRFDKDVDWFNIHEDCKEFASDSLVLRPDGSNREKPGYHVLNVQMRPRDIKKVPDSKPLAEMTEEELEMYFFRNNKSLFLAAGIGSDSQPLRQIPVGLFKERLSRNTRVFTGTTSMIDLGALDDTGTLAIFELKRPGNVKVGAITELLFYANVIRDLQEGTFGYPAKKKREAEIQIAKSRGVKAFILADRLHPVLSNKRVFETLNTIDSRYDQEFGFIRYEETPEGISCVRETLK